MTDVLALIAIVPAVAPLYFGMLWLGFAYWRRHPIQAYAMLIGTLAAAIATVVVIREPLLSAGIEPPLAIRVVGWLIVAVACVIGAIADRQIGFRVRSFAPLFANEPIELRTTGVYGLVRHPIYATGLWFQIGAALVSGVLAVAIAAAVFAAGALWFTRQEERRLIERLADPTAYARYRERVPALFPRLRPTQ